MNSNLTKNNDGISLRNSAFITGIGLIIMAILAPVANFAILQKLIVSGNAAKTTSNIIASEGLFRLCIGFFFIVAILDIIVGWALYIFLKPVNKSLSLLTACFRLIYATILSVLLINLIQVLELIKSGNYISAFGTNQLQTAVIISINAFTHGWKFSLIIFGFHLLALGYLLFKAGYMHKILGILIIVASLGYLLDGFGKLIFSNYNINVSMFTFIGEVVLIFWLLIKGVKIHENI